MSQNKSSVLETDVVSFPTPYLKAAYEKTVEEASAESETKKESVSKIKKDRFARLKRSLRKKSVSIL